jgi:hypothetical protein
MQVLVLLFAVVRILQLAVEGAVEHAGTGIGMRFRFA